MRHTKINGGFILIPRDTIMCNQYKGLKLPTKAVYTAILTEFIRDKGKNPNNRVKISHTQIEDRSGVGHGSAVRGVKELKEKGFMKVLVPGGLEGNPTVFQLNGRFTHSGNTESSW